MNFSNIILPIEQIDKSRDLPEHGIVVYKDGRKIYEYLSGFKDIEKRELPKGNELFYIYSCTKLMTVCAAMSLVDRKIISLEDKLSDYIEEYKVMKLLDGTVAKNEILIRDLFSMSSGMRYEISGAEIDRVRAMSDGRCPTVDIARAIASRPLSFEPNTNFYYSLSHDILAAVIEVVTGRKYYDYIKEHILEPCGMNETYVNTAVDFDKRAATKYGYDGRRNEYIADEQRNRYILGSDYQSGGAGIITTLQDYAKFINMLSLGGKTAQGGIILSRDAIDAIRTPVSSIGVQKGFLKATADRFNDGYGYGLGVFTVSDPKTAGLNVGKYSFGWDGAAGSFAFADCENCVAIFYIQHVHGRHIVDHLKLVSEVYKHIF